MFGFRKRRNAPDFARELLNAVANLPQAQRFHKICEDKLTQEQRTVFVREWRLLEAWSLHWAVIRSMAPSQQRDLLLQGVDTVASQIAAEWLDSNAAPVFAQERFLQYSNAWVKGPPKDDTSSEFDDAFSEIEAEFEREDELNNTPRHLTWRAETAALEDRAHLSQLVSVLLQHCRLGPIRGQTQFEQDLLGPALTFLMVATELIAEVVPKYKIT